MDRLGKLLHYPMPNANAYLRRQNQKTIPEIYYDHENVWWLPFKTLQTFIISKHMRELGVLNKHAKFLYY